MKALILLSGGLDSRLALKIMQEQVKTEAVHFKLPFEGCCLPDCSFKFSQLQGIKLHIIDLTKGKLFQDYLKLIKNPKHGYGSSLNPCIDCRIFMLKKAKQLMKKINAKFLVTGDVLGERPMTQLKHKLKLIEKKSKLEGKILRPLSAKLLEETEAEKNKWINRGKLYAIRGRKRKEQIKLAKKFKLKDFPNPAGGCILCEKGFSNKLKDLFEHKKRISFKDIQLLRIGRHFRYKKEKIIVGRNEKENDLLKILKDKQDYQLEVPDIGSPLTVLKGKSLEKAASLTARYSDSKDKKVLVKYGKKSLNKNLTVKKITERDIEKIRV